jgi:hypothetical protein
MKLDMKMAYRPGAESDSKGEGVLCNLCSHYSRQPGPTIHNDGCPIAYLEALEPLLEAVLCVASPTKRALSQSLDDLAAFLEDTP